MTSSANVKVPENAESNNLGANIPDSNKLTLISEQPADKEDAADIDYTFLDECENQFKINENFYEDIEQRNFEGVLSRWEKTCNDKNIVEDIALTDIQNEIQITDGVNNFMILNENEINFMLF